MMIQAMVIMGILDVLPVAIGVIRSREGGAAKQKTVMKMAKRV